MRSHRKKKIKVNRRRFAAFLVVCAAVVVCAVFGIRALLNNTKTDTQGTDTQTEQQTTAQQETSTKQDTAAQQETTTDGTSTDSSETSSDQQSTDSTDTQDTTDSSTQSTLPEEVPGDWKLLLVNPWNKIPDGYSPTVVEVESGYRADERCADFLALMLADCRAAGYSPAICSGYREHSTQEYLFQQEVQTFLDQGYEQAEAETLAATSVAVPGTSEHECGLAFDIVDNAYWVLDDSQAERPTQQWLMTHCSDYGFILRYPEGKESVTGIMYEPWHYRYVGVEAAKAIMSSGICLEEYLGE